MMGESDPARWGPTHLVEVSCACTDIEDCVTEKYISDVRILMTELHQPRVIYARWPSSDPT